MVPAAVPHPLRRDLRVALDVPADVQAQRQDRAVVLEREQHAVVAVLLAEDLAVAAQLGGLGPGAERDPRGVGQRNLLADPQQVRAGQAQGVAEQPAAADQRRRGRRHAGVPAVAAGVRALVPRDFVEGPVGDQAGCRCGRGGRRVALRLSGGGSDRGQDHPSHRRMANVFSLNPWNQPP